ncbi:uncharacterized protein LOC115034929 [Acyrthosiphon pisum]|uniref:Uncharacterized protein n=1 Tax=Acyrthosiphon pisum TaxID=7029 RepID=A0A8R2JVD7_ACYPI|nr:uncharacterized protein LOC115034929 [Acyrthosiphon pisum]
MVKRIMAIIFIPEILCEFSYSGRGNKKRPFEKLLVNKIIFESVLTIKKFATADNAANEIEQVIKCVLIQTPFKIKDRFVSQLKMARNLLNLRFLAGILRMLTPEAPIVEMWRGAQVNLRQSFTPL